MSENEVKKAFNAIEPEDGTRERMYANILKKAAAQRAAAPEENADAPAAESNASPKTVPLPARRPTPRWKRYSAMAACLALVTTLTIGFLHPFLPETARETSRRFWAAHRSRMCRARRTLKKSSAS